MSKCPMEPHSALTKDEFILNHKLKIKQNCCEMLIKFLFQSYSIKQILKEENISQQKTD